MRARVNARSVRSPRISSWMSRGRPDSDKSSGSSRLARRALLRRATEAEATEEAVATTTAASLVAALPAVAVAPDVAAAATATCELEGVAGIGPATRRSVSAAVSEYGVVHLPAAPG